MLQVQIVTYNSEDALPACLDSLLLQSRAPDRVLVIDNASTDPTKQVITAYEHAFHAKNIAYETLFLSVNTGYAAGHNQGIRAALTHHVDFLCTINPDVRMEPDYLQYAFADFRLDAQMGGVTGKLLRPQAAPSTLTLDSAGLQMQAFYHVRDRGQEDLDRGQYDEPAYVWGVCGAAAVYRREMLEQLAYLGQYFDESFFIYKEDVDLCWRGGERGWKFYYEPRALAWHGRGWKKGDHASTPALIHSFANQIALLIKHVPNPTLVLWLSLIVESLRLCGIAVRSPSVANAILQKIRNEWATTWAWRKAVQR